MHLFLNNKKKEANRILIEQILLEQYDKYYRLAISYVHSESDAYDIVQNGVYKALRGSDTLKKPEYAQTWVYRIMLNECFRFLKQPQHCSYDEIQEETGKGLQPIENRGTDIDLQGALDTLPEQDKAVVILRFFEEMKLEEIADILEENVNTVKSRLYRSLKKLRSVIGEDT
ncbi:MAG: sigma-70 family RNA polymerase sigma factor [Lachnospiraceae bacterium]|jgi:RNA polymerase sigma-70 factor (ECF subfamily)|nr:sigma-70 family RNA polymerase sigma factor [Lachnospiraceae bacterium]